MNREKGIQDARSRYNKIKDKITLVFERDQFGFKYPEGLNNLTFNEYGRMCELGYIISSWNIKESELQDCTKK